MKTSENYIRKLVEEGLRVDDRKFDELRKIKLEIGIIDTAEGSARVMIGDTLVLVGVKMSIGEPYPDTPNEGMLIVNAELVPVASPTFESGPPSAAAIELARVVDRGIRESKAIDMEKLCLEEGKKVWAVNIDIHVIDHDGNLIDASALGAIAALMHTRIPKYQKERVIFGEYQGKLPMNDKPIAITTFKISDKLLIDSNLEEENALDARITITTNDKEEICAIQKGGEGYFTTAELERAADLSIHKGKELRKLLK